jgi:hypothetical protein
MLHDVLMIHRGTNGGHLVQLLHVTVDCRILDQLALVALWREETHRERKHSGTQDSSRKKHGQRPISTKD